MAVLDEPIVAWHLIICTYGFWLPNDPRGSWSDYVRAPAILAAGGSATGGHIRRSVAGVRHDSAARRAAKAALAYPPVQFTGLQARAVGRGLATAVHENGYVVRACAIMPDHLHIVLDVRGQNAGRIVGHLKARATQQLHVEGIHPQRALVNEAGEMPSPWAHGHWCVFVHSSELAGVIQYVEMNPVRAGLPRQAWIFIQK